MGVTHTPKTGPLLTGTEYEAADSHILNLVDADIPATIARDTEVTTAVSNHSAAADPHTVYRLESEDHTHASSGAQAGTISHAVLTSVTATDHHAAAVAGPDADVSVDAAGAAGTASTFARSGHGHQVVTTDAPSGANITIDAAASAAATGAIARAAHGHRLNTYASTPAAVGTGAAGTSTTAPARGDHVHATGAGTPSTQAFADAATTGSGPAASMTDHKHAMPTLGYGLSGNSAPAVGLSTVSAAATATTSISTAAYADITGLSTGSLAAGTWLLIATVNGSIVNAHALMHVAITHSDNTVQREASSAIPASGSANVASNGHVTVVAIVSGGATYKVRGARGNTTLTGTWVAMDGTGVGVTNNLTDNSDKGSHIIGIRIA